LDGEDFILQVHGVFTRIRLGDFTGGERWRRAIDLKSTNWRRKHEWMVG
jgi:hypothetical protein